MPKTIANRIGFGINFADMIHHYAPIWRLMGTDRVGVVPFGTEREQEEIRAAVRALGYQIFEADALIIQDAWFDVFVSHQYLAMTGELPIFKRLGQYNLRFMYTLAQDGWNFADWNAHYDGFLCYGPYQASRFAQKFPDKAVVQMGYPRFDDFFNGIIDANVVRLELTCDQEKPTVVWLPAYGFFSSVDRYCDTLAALTDRFNVVVKPHPYTVTGEPDRMARLHAAGFTHVIDTLYDNLKLLSLADWIVCDYGGPIFGTIYTDQKLLLLDLAGASDHALVGPESPEIRVRRDIISTETTNPDEICRILNNKDIWTQQAVIRNNLRQEFFAPFYGFSSRIAANILENAGKIFYFG